jgi:hypothetical protein
VLSGVTATTLTVPPGGGARGAVYTPPVLIDPHAPTARLAQCTDQPGLIVLDPTVAMNVCWPPAVTVTAAGLTTTGRPEFVMVTLAEPIWVVSCCETADIVTLLGVGTTAGAVYKPAVEIVPTVALPPTTVLTSQFTLVFVALVTVAVNCWVCLVCSVALRGEIATETVVEELEELLLLPPHATSENESSRTASAAVAARQIHTSVPPVL